MPPRSGSSLEAVEPRLKNRFSRSFSLPLIQFACIQLYKVKIFEVQVTKILCYILVMDASPNNSFPIGDIDPYEQSLLEERTIADINEC